MEKQGVTFSKSIVEIRKKQKQVLMFAKMGAGKGSADDNHIIEKAKSKRTEEMELALFFLSEVYCDKKSIVLA